MTEILSISAIAISLTFDTLAVSVSSGIREKNMKFQRGVIIASILAIIQAIAPIAGWTIGAVTNKLWDGYTYIISFLLLLCISIKMFIESFKKEEDKYINRLKLSLIVLIGIATSIDAFVVGISIALLKYDIKLMAILTFIFTFSVAMIGMYVGKKSALFIGKRSEIAGAIVLAAIAIKILIENIF